MKTFIKGRRGEQQAAEFLLKKGYRILERNFRTKRGEIDLIAEKGDTLSFVEVKAWGSVGFEGLEHAIGYRKQSSIINTSKKYLAGLKDNRYSYINYDVVFIDNNAGRIEFLKNAFTEKKS